MPTILADARPPAELPLRIRFADLGGTLGRLVGSTLYLDPSRDADEHLYAIADAATFLRTGVRPPYWPAPARRLAVVR